jgi:hypothetical protein
LFSRPYLEKNLTQTRAGGVVQVVEYLPSKCEALNSNPSTAKKKKKKERKKAQNGQVRSLQKKYLQKINFIHETLCIRGDLNN